MPKYSTTSCRGRNGQTRFRVTWFDGDHRHKCRTFDSAEERLKFVNEMKREDAAKRAVERTARTAGDYVARFSRLDVETQNLLLGALDSVKAAGGRAEDIRDAVDGFISRLGGGKSVREAVEAHLEDVRKFRRHKTFKGRRQELKPFLEAFGARPLGSLSRGECREWIMSGASASKREHRHKALSAFLRDCVRREWLRGSPMEGLETPRGGVREDVAIFSAGEAERLLRKAAEVAPAMVPFYAIGLFAGLRPERELRGLEERDIDLDGRQIYVRWKRSKTWQSRSVPISGNLAAWLKAFPLQLGRVWFSKAGHKRVLAAAGITWQADIMRHSRASYRLAEIRNPAVVADEMGHDVTTLKRHYANRRIPAADVEAFWGILPPAADGAAAAKPG